MEGELNVESAILAADNAIIKLRVIANNNKYLHRSKILQKEEGFGKGFEVRKLGG